jgi:hypothetical protein
MRSRRAADTDVQPLYYSAPYYATWPALPPSSDTTVLPGVLATQQFHGKRSAPKQKKYLAKPQTGDEATAARAWLMHLQLL